jgi:hypothetical protein
MNSFNPMHSRSIYMVQCILTHPWWRCRATEIVLAPRKPRTVIDDNYIYGLLWQERVDIFIALLCAFLCTLSNLAAPVLSGYFIECLAGKQPMSLYPKVRFAFLYSVQILVNAE